MAEDEKTENLFDDKKIDTDAKVTILTLMTGIFSGVLFLAGSGAGLLIDENLPPSNDNRAGQEIALQQYDRMFNVLAEQRETLSLKNMAFSSLAAIDYTPDMLKEVVGLDAEEQGLYADVTRAKNEIAQAETQLHELAEKFAYSAIVDERLSEANVRDLFNRFEKNIGTMESVAGIDAPDYSDLDQSRARINEKSSDYSDTKEKAQAISDDSNNINGDTATGIAGPLGGALGIAFMLWLIGDSYAHSNYRKRRRQSRKFNH